MLFLLGYQGIWIGCGLCGRRVATVIDPGQAIGLMLPLLMLMDVTSLKPYWGQWLKKESLYLCLGGMPGVALGVWFYSLADADMLRLLIGVISLLFVIWTIQATWFAPGRKPPLGRWTCRSCRRVYHFVSHAGGPRSNLFTVRKAKQNGISGHHGYCFLGHKYCQGLAIQLFRSVHVETLSSI